MPEQLQHYTDCERKQFELDVARTKVRTKLFFELLEHRRAQQLARRRQIEQAREFEVVI